MSLAKKAAIGFLSFLLFCSLSTFGVTFAINRTVLNPDFVIAQLDRLDVPSLAGEVLREQLPLEQILGETEFIAESVDDVIADLEPWIREQASAAIYAGYDYFLGRSESLSLIIDVEPAKETVRESLWQAFIESPPPELAGLPSAEVERHFDEFYQEFSEQIPTTFEINESMIGPEIMVRLEQARHYIGYVQIAYWAAIGAMIALILGIIFLHRRVKGATRLIGGPCLSCGISALVGTLVIKYFVGAMLTQIDLPTQLQTWLPQFLNDLLAPMQMYGIGLVVAGVALLIVSVAYKRRQPSVNQE